MKKLALSIVATVITLVAYAQDKTQGAEIAFKEDAHDFGTVQINTPQEFIFVFTNSGNKPLTITEVKTICACTYDFTKEPVEPGKTGIIKVAYDAKTVGNINDMFTIVSNARTSNKNIYTVMKVGGPTTSMGGVGAPEN